MFKYVHHINYAVRNRDEMVAYIERTFGMKPYKVLQVEGQQKEAQYLVGPTLVRFREPYPGRNPSPEFLEQRGPGIILVSWAVDNLSQVAQDLITKGINIKSDRRTLSDKPGVRQNTQGYVTVSIDPQGEHGPPALFQLSGEAE